MKYLVNIILVLSSVASLTFMSPMIAAAAPAKAPAKAANCSSTNPSVNEAMQGVGVANGGCSNAQSSDKINGVLTNIVNLLSSIVGVAAVIMIIVGGFKYVTSGGDSNKVSGAKSTIIYAIIGLIIVALAQVIVHFVLNTAA